MPGRWTRRRLLGTAAAALPAGTALGGLLAGCGPDGAGTAAPGTGTAAGGTPAPATAAPAPAEPLPENVRETLRAAVGRMLPADAEPGALELGAFEYIEAQLATPTFSRLYRTFIFGGVTLDRLAQTRTGGARFHTLAPEVQDDVLAEFATGVDLKRDLDTADFFVKLLNFAMEGCLGPEKYGGNKGGAGWKLVGFSPHVPG